MEIPIANGLHLAMEFFKFGGTLAVIGGAVGAGWGFLEAGQENPLETAQTGLVFGAIAGCVVAVLSVS